MLASRARMGMVVDFLRARAFFDVTIEEISFFWFAV